MSWLELIGKVLFYGVTTAAVVAVAIVAVVVIWLAYEQAQGRNPFQ